MVVDREVLERDDADRGAPPADVSAPPVDLSAPPGDVHAPPADVSTATFVWYALLGVVLAGWFLFGWLVQNQGLVDSAGESLGTGFALLLAVSVVGTIRRSRR